MSELTSDMVWFVNKEITLADGRKVTALVPQVYLVARNSDINSRGAWFQPIKFSAMLIRWKTAA